MDNPKGHVTSFNSNDPIEAIYALNIGDFLAEDFISTELLGKINERLASDPEKLKRQLDEMIQIYSIDKTLGILGFTSEEGFVIYDSIASTLARMFEVDACHMFQSAYRDTGEEYLSLTGTSKDLSSQERWKIGIQVKASDLLGRTALDDETRVLSSLDKVDDWHPIEKLGQEKVKSLIAAPLTEGGRHLGLILFESHRQQHFPNELVTLAEATCRVFVTAIRLQQLVARAQAEIQKPDEQSHMAQLRSLRAEITESIADLGEHQQTFVESLGAAIDARYDFTKGHSQRVAHVARSIAETMNLNEKTVDLVYYAGLLGTIGKMDIPKQVIAKRDKLTQKEWENLRYHPNVGVSLLVQINFISEVIPYVHYQHERWDGSGTPEGLQGRDIPLGSRILSVADAYQAMTADRPYREKAMSLTEAIQSLQTEAGTKWDPDVVATLANIPSDLLL